MKRYASAAYCSKLDVERLEPRYRGARHKALRTQPADSSSKPLIRLVPES
ncbi:MAG: hypothetical protein KME19_02495 [Microcoleus vaginatus WJT46-NPBG5]|nr:hypothetical protein [Microcoleus vaginatus WJT46-NPBG5]